jgi:hypothetical protein
MRSSRLLAPLALALASACSNPQSFIVLNLHVATNDIATEIPGVTEVVVTVSKVVAPTASPRILSYDASVVDGGSLTLTKEGDRTLSVSFSGDESGTMAFAVSVLDQQRCVVGMGEATQQIRKGASTEVAVAMVSMHDCSTDGGVPPDGGPGGTLPGCDPVSPATRDAGVTTCTAVQTCQINCTARRNECIMGGSGAPGAICQTNADCQPGTQCFDYTSTGCGTKVCLRFCGSDVDCAAIGAGGGGPGSVCEGRVVCGTADTAYHTCTFNCDPTAAAAGPTSRGGCPGSLACLMPASMDEVDCACPEPTRTKVNGETCTGAADCAPGFICNLMNSTRVCRAICRCNKNASGACGTPNTCPGTTTCTPVTNNALFGVCL